MESRRVYLCFLLFLISSVFSAIDHTGLEDGSSLEWSIVNKVKASEEASLVANGKFEYFLQPFTDDGTKTSDGYADSEYDWAPAFAIDQSSCSKDQYNTIVKAGKPKPAVRSWAMHYIQYTPTQDIELIVELTRYNLNQTYSPKLQIVSFLNNGYTDVNRTPADDASIKYEDSMYCGGTIMDLCTNSDSPLSFVFLKGLTYLFQIYAGNLNNTGTLNPNITVGKFYLGLTVANQIWIEDFNNVSVGSLPTGWVASINPTTAPTRNPNSTWVVGDIAYLDGTRTDEGSGNVYGVYLPIDMDPAGGVTFIKNFLGFNPNIRCNDTSYCKRVNESVVTGPIDLTSFTNGLIFQFSATLDNSYRPTGSSTATDWTATLYYSLDDGATWPESQKLLGGNFPLISTLTNHATQWLTYQYNANAVAGKVFRLKFVLDQKAASTTRYFGIDNIRFITNNHHKTCMLPFTCANPSCPVAFNYTLTAANPQGYQGCGYAPVNSRCSTALSNECTDAFCRPDLIVGGTADSTTGCAVVTNVSRCTAGASCETPSCSATSGCSYSQDDSLCASGASPCADYYCDTTAHKGCQYNYTLSSTDVAKHHDPRIVCNDNAACTSDVCRPLGYTTSGSDNYDSTTGCTHSTIANYCDTNNGTFGSTECSVSTCDPAAAAAAIDNQAPAGSGCYSKPVDSLCTQGSDCDHVSCSFSTGCVYNGDASLCTAHTQCITPTCISKQGAGNGCDYSDNTTNIALCSDSFSCTDDFCTNVGSTTDSGCVHLARNDICVPGNSSSIYGNAECVTSACDPTNPSAEVGTGCFSTKHDDMCDDYSRECESNSCDFNAGCQYTPNHSICQAKTGDCINAVCEHGKTTGGCDFTDNTTKLESTCSGGSECQVTSCQHVPHPLTSGFDNGCRYESVDSICQAKTTNCTNAICDGFNGCDYSDVTTNVGMCDDGYACTEDYCTSDLSAPLTSGCHNDAQDSYCALSAAGATCADSVCAPSSSTDSTGCEITEHDDRCTSDSLCADAKCSNVTGCSYTANDDFCALLGPKCNIYTCYLVNYKSSYDPTEWSQKDANGCFAKHNCSDGIACTVDVCQANDMCKHTADNSKCQQSQGCTENICAPSNSSSDPDGCIYYSRCDDKIDCTRDECVNTTAGRDKCLHTVDMKLCDDHVDCTYELLCDVNAVHYDSGIPSIVKSYDNITGCIRVPMNEWCDDGLPCTIDVCQPTNSTQTGGCVHWPIDCDDGIPCTVDSCDELTGNCKHEDDPDYCNDDIICTIDKCDHALGMCTNIPDDTECSAFSPDKCHDAYCRPSMTSGSDGCFFLERSCNDGIACTDDSCDALTGACSHQANNTHCDDGGECTDDRCDDVLGKCVNIPNSDHCNDGLPCTVDFCDCETGNCVHTAVDCSDEIACTVDSCNNTDGRCTHTPQADLCDDGVLCTDDICNTELGRCVNVKNDLFCETLHSDNKSVNWACQPPSVLTVYSDPHIDGCVAVAKNCDDDILCTYDYADPVTGICSHTPFDNLCNDGSECNDYSCSTTLGCIAKPNDTKCDDNLNCTVDSCGCDGKCEHKQLYCNDEIACTDDSCNEALGGVCVYTANNVSCDDSIDCTFDTCDLVRGCSNIPHDEVCGSTECSFGVCVIGYGGCQYELHDELCDDRIQCTMDYCDPVNGTCAHVTQDGLCDDGIPCTSDVCTPDGCVYTPNDDWCDDGVSCTDNICSTEYGCQYVPVVSRCDDNLNCTLDTCDEVLDCIHTAQNALCSDGISCTLDVCNTTLGACTNTAMDSYCSDDFNCTTESCDASADAGTTGCVIDVSNCTWANPQLLWLDTQSAKAQILEKRTSDGSSMDFLTSDQNGELLPRISFTADNKVIFGGNQQTTRLSDGDGVVMNYPLRLVPVTEDSLGECNEIRRGTIAVAEIITPCGDRMCNSDTVVVCMLGAKYEWMKFSP